MVMLENGKHPLRCTARLNRQNPGTSATQTPIFREVIRQNLTRSSTVGTKSHKLGREEQRGLQ
jgi:hypothetical protein